MKFDNYFLPGIKEVKKIRKHTIKKEDNFNSTTKYKTNIIVPLLLLTLALIFSFTINDVSAAQGTSINTITPSDNLTVSTGTAVESRIIKQTKTNVSTTNKTVNTLNSKKNQKLPDPQIYRNGVPVGPVYTTIADAISNAQSGDTIMLENGAIFKEHDLTINKNLDFKVFNNGHATIDANNLGRVFLN